MRRRDGASTTRSTRFIAAREDAERLDEPEVMVARVGKERRWPCGAVLDTAGGPRRFELNARGRSTHRKPRPRAGRFRLPGSAGVNLRTSEAPKKPPAARRAQPHRRSAGEGPRACTPGGGRVENSSGRACWGDDSQPRRRADDGNPWRASFFSQLAPGIQRPVDIEPTSPR